MPRRHTQQNPEDDDNVIDMDEQPPPKKKKSRIPTWVKWFGAVAGGSIVGGLAMRKYDQYFPPEPRDKGNDGGDGEVAGNQQGALPAAPAPSPFMPVFSFGGAAPQQNPAPAPSRRRKSTGQLKQELRQRQQEERATKYSAAEDAFFEDD